MELYRDETRLIACELTCTVC